MPLSSIVVIVIRLFALNWLLSAVPLLLSAATTPLRHERRLSAALMPYAPAVPLAHFRSGTLDSDTRHCPVCQPGRGYHA